MKMPLKLCLLILLKNVIMRSKIVQRWRLAEKCVVQNYNKMATLLVLAGKRKWRENSALSFTRFISLSLKALFTVDWILL